MTLPVTAFVAACSALLLLITAILTVRARLAAKVAFGDGGVDAITRASRSHGNLAEHAPIVIILLFLLESARANHMALMVIGAVFLVGRVAHIIGLHTPSEAGKAPVMRQIGVISTWLTLLLLSGWTIVMLSGNIGS